MIRMNEKDYESEPDLSVIELDSDQSEEVPLLKRPIRMERRKKPVLPIRIDLTQTNSRIIEIDSSEDEEPPKSAKHKQVEPVSIMIPDSDQPELIDLVAIEQRNTMLFQYKKQLGIEDDDKSGIRMRQIKKNIYALQSKAYEKYNDKAETKTLKSLVSMIEHFDETQAHDLLSDEWLNDEVIRQYFEILVKQNDHIAVVRSGYAMDPKDFFEKLKNNANNVKKTRNQLLNAQRILWPICEGNHWYLVMIDKTPNGMFNIFCLDGFNSQKETHLEKAKLLLQSLYPDQAIDDLINKQDFINVPKQNNDVDCGVAICYYAKLCTNKTLPKSKIGVCNYSQFRFDIAEELVKTINIKETFEESPIKKRHPKHTLKY